MMISHMLLALMALGGAAAAATSVEIDLSAQRAYLLENGRRVASSPIASGKRSHPTSRGNFRVTQKNLHHRSTIYGRIVGANGRVLNADAKSTSRVPRGARFVAAPMPYFMRFRGAMGMHAGHLPGYAASHGCVRMPRDKAALFFSQVQVGTPVRVFGRAS